MESASEQSQLHLIVCVVTLLPVNDSRNVTGGVPIPGAVGILGTVLTALVGNESYTVYCESIFQKDQLKLQERDIEQLQVSLRLQQEENRRISEEKRVMELNKETELV